MDPTTIDPNQLATAISHLILGILQIISIWLHLHK